MTRDELFKIALETRNLEIELFWKRATFFWAFQASALALVAVCVRGFNDGGESPNFLLYWGAFSGLILGTFASLAGYLASRGSKYWQESWEMKLDYFDEGRLFRAQWKAVPVFNGQGAYSVSKIASNFFFVCFVFWSLSLIIVLILLFKMFFVAADSTDYLLFMVYFSLLFVVVVSVVFIYYSKSGNYENMTASSVEDEGFYGDGLREELNSGDAAFRVKSRRFRNYF